GNRFSRRPEIRGDRPTLRGQVDLWVRSSPRNSCAPSLQPDSLSSSRSHYRSELLVGRSCRRKPRVKVSSLLPRDEHAENVVGQKLASIGENFALINPGAGWGAKQWPAGRYGAVASALSKRGLTPLINFGPGEQSLTLQVQEASAGIAQPISCPIS